MLSLVGGVDEENGDVGAGGGEDVAGHGDHAGQHLFVDQMLADAFVDAGLGGDEAGRHHDGRFAAGLERVNDVLQEQLVDCHFVGGLGLDLGDAGKKACVGWLWCPAHRGNR